ncbi:MAG TPA: hypothetical protein VK684_09490 [Edaphobacter sp.]|nr:hypothetical protein [Edaphobacter sp.]
MRGSVAKWIVAMGAGVALIAAQGCRKQPAAASVQPAALSLPRVQLDFPVGPLPVEDVDTGARPRVDHAAPPLQVQPVQVQRADVQNEAVVDGQRVQDTRLLQEQETASERQQEELNRDIERDVKTRDEMQAEPRIQEIPEVPLEAVPLQSTQPE